jgi:hypothetical protein
MEGERGGRGAGGLFLFNDTIEGLRQNVKHSLKA